MTSEQAWFQKAIGAFTQRLLVISPEFEILAVNQTPEGFTHEEILGRRCYEVFYDGSGPCEECAVAEAIDSGFPVFKTRGSYDIEARRVPCYYCYPIYEDGKLAAYVSVDFDVPALQMIEEKLNRSNAFLENLILSAADCVIAADRKGKIFIFNDAAVELFGYTTKYALAELNVRDIYKEDVAYEIMKKLRAEEPDGPGKLKDYFVEAVDHCGNLVPINLYASVVYEGSKEVATIGYFHDLRVRLRLQKQAERSQLQVLQSEKMASLGRLAAGVAHQLNNPLGGIILFTKLVMEEYDLAEEAQDDLERVMTEAKRCRDTVKELLEFARQTRQLRSPHDLNRAINRTLFLLESQVLFQNITVERAFADPSPVTMVDLQQINHVLMNIILNAAQAMEGRGKLILCTSQDEERVRIEIQDTGPGIPEHVLSHIFDPFFTTKGEGEGTGLGLSLVYGIVKEHDGRVHAENRPEGGASFIIELPIVTEPNGVEKRGEPS